MGNIKKKAEKKLARRLAFYDECVKRFGADWGKAHKKPGSLKYKK